MRFKSLFILCALLLSACAQGANNAQPSDSPASSMSASPTPSESAVLFGVKIYFVGDTGTSLKLYSEQRAVPGVTSVAWQDALSFLLSGEKPLDSDYQNLWGGDAKLNSLTIVGDLATIDLHFSNLNVGAEAEARAIDQILWTLKANYDLVSRVEFLRDGAPMETFAGHVDATGIFEIGPGYESLSSVDLDVEEVGVLEKPYVVTGLACTFEANVPWELTQGSKVTKSGSVLAKEACPTRSKFTIELGDLEPGKYVLRVWESSMQDGSLINEDTKTILIQ